MKVIAWLCEAAIVSCAVAGCSSAPAGVDAVMEPRCVDIDARNPTLTQAFEGFRDAMIHGQEDPAQIADLRRELAPDKQADAMRQVDPTMYATLVTLIDQMPADGYRKYVRAVCDTEHEWDQPLDHSAVRWAMVWDGLMVCSSLMKQPASERDSYVESQARMPAVDGTDSAWLNDHAEIKTRAARNHLCPQ